MTPPSSHRICLLESRREDAIGACLAAESVLRHQPDAPVHLYGIRPEDAGEALHLHGDAYINPSLPEGIHAWNCKPHAILPLLQRYGGRVTWLDSDLIVTAPFSHLFDGDDSVLVIACESANAPTPPGCLVRARGWGFPATREITPTPNTCIVSFTTQHIPLLERWRDILNSAEYKRLQAMPLTERPLHAWSDQDVLSALLAGEYAGVPVRVLRRGHDFIHVGHSLSYHGRERMGNLLRLPPFVHSGAARPWSAQFFETGGASGWLRRVNRDVSPYYLSALAYSDSYPAIRQWRKKETVTGRLLRLAAFGNPALAGLPLWLAASVVRSLAPRRPLA